jgi:protein involved in plasmid replication-relaxation
VQLRQWLPEAACQRIDSYVRVDDPIALRAYQPRVRPDGYGVWTKGERTVPFFLEYYTGGEQLAVLTDKLTGYRDLFRTLGRVWPVLFWLRSTARERNLRRRLDELPHDGAGGHRRLRRRDRARTESNRLGMGHGRYSAAAPAVSRAGKPGLRPKSPCRRGWEMTPEHGQLSLADFSRQP